MTYATGSNLNSTQTELKVGYLDSLFSPDHFSYIICYIWSYDELIMNFQSLSLFEFNAYGCFALFTQFKLVKHENKVHIHNPWIFLIILDILFIKFGVKMNYL